MSEKSRALPEHLRALAGPRGLSAMPAIRIGAVESVEASESSAALDPGVWLRQRVEVTPMAPDGAITGPTELVETALHLSAEEAWRLAEQLMALVRGHYQGDARPVVAERYADLIEDGDDKEEGARP